MPTARHPATSGLVTRRRAVLGLAAGVTVALNGCTPGDEPDAAPSPTLPPDDDDQGLVAEVTAALAAQQALVQAALADFPALGRDLQPFRRLHRIHLGTLDGHDGEAETPGRPAGNRRATRRLVLRGEERLQRRLVSASVAAGSGSLAKLLASMSAAVAQQLAVSR